MRPYIGGSLRQATLDRILPITNEIVQTPGVEPVFLMWIAVFFRRIRTVDHHPYRGYAAVTLTFDKWSFLSESN
jgi:hypothetical protein